MWSPPTRLLKAKPLAYLRTWQVNDVIGLCAQMGGKAGVDKAEVYALVTGLSDGMWMHARPRVPQTEHKA